MNQETLYSWRDFSYGVDPRNDSLDDSVSAARSQAACAPSIAEGKLNLDPWSGGCREKSEQMNSAPDSEQADHFHMRNAEFFEARAALHKAGAGIETGG